MGAPLAHLITIACYGNWLHGDPRDSVDRFHNTYGERRCVPDARRMAFERFQMTGAPYSMDALRRRIVGESIEWLCEQKGWTPLAWHIREVHLHGVLRGILQPDRALLAIKAEASRQLNIAGLDGKTCKRWARGGSAKPIWYEESMYRASRYVLDGQGEPMERGGILLLT